MAGTASQTPLTSEHKPAPLYRQFLHWSGIAPVLGWLLYLSGFALANPFMVVVSALLLTASVMAAVHHSEVVAHKVGEPFGTIILALAVTILESSIIISLMTAGGEGTATLARDTLFAAVMIILNGILGICFLFGGLKFHEQFFARSSANVALVALVAILVFTLILPNYTTSTAAGTYSVPQMIFVALSCLVLYGTFILVQTVRHRNYFLPEGEAETPHVVTRSEAILSLVFLLIALGIVVLLAKTLSPTIEAAVVGAGLPVSLVGVIIAAVILMPESIAAVNAARRNKLQISINLALGSALASIGLTIPVVVTVCVMYDIPLVLGLDKKAVILLGLSVFTAMLSLSKGKTNILYGVVSLVNLAAYIFTIIFP